MKKVIQRKIEETYCDGCEQKADLVCYVLSCGYGSINDDTVFHFCSDKCLKSFVLAHVGREKDD